MTASATQRILLLDDDPFMLRLLVRMLAQLGHMNVIAHTAAEQALQEIGNAKAPIDLIVLHTAVPGMDGTEFIRRLIASGYDGSVALMRGDDGRSHESLEKLLQQHGLAALCDLQKPVNIEDLERLLRSLEASARRRRNAAVPSYQYPLDQLRAAIGDGELINYYQPKVALSTGAFVGVECLVRWRHPQDGLVYPDHFIPLAAQHGLMPDLTFAVFEMAMKQVKSWTRFGHHVPVALNVSIDDLTALDFPDNAVSLTRAAGIEPQLITLEITEGQLMKQLATALDVISRLRQKRFRLAIDDFGTGHSSLAQLRDLPFDEMKIDRSFVHGASQDVTLRAICSASLRMAQQLKLHVVAEGLELREDWSLLRRLGCEAAQGYLIARPMPASDLISWIENWGMRQLEGVPLDA